MSEPERRDDRWICWRCGDLDHLSKEGLCHACTPEQVMDWWQVAVVIASGEQVRRQRRWEVK